VTILLVTRSFVTGEAMFELENSLYNSKENALKELLYNYGIDSIELQRKQLLGHIELLIEINERLNLTRITSIDDALILHILDSLLPLKVCDEFVSSSQNYIDIGTGGGFPGLPLAIMSNNKTLRKAKREAYQKKQESEGKNIVNWIFIGLIALAVLYLIIMVAMQ